MQEEWMQNGRKQKAGSEQPAFFSQKIHQNEQKQGEAEDKKEKETEEKEQKKTEDRKEKETKEKEQKKTEDRKEKETEERKQKKTEDRKVQEKRRLRVAAYIRVSTDGSSQEDSYEIQMRYFTQILMENPTWISAGVYCDYGISGTSKERRMGLRRLMRHCEEGRIDRVVCKSVSRFARNTRDFLKALESLKKHHVTIAFEKEGLDTAAAQNDLFFTAFAAIAQEESRSISNNVSWSIRRRYPKGEVRNFVIYGYRYAGGKEAVQVTESGYRFRQVEVIPEEAEVVRRIFAELAEGETYVSIARGLNFDRIAAPESAVVLRRRKMEQTPKGRLKKGLNEGWTADHIRQIGHLERYMGDVKLQKTYKPDYRSHKKLVNQGELPQYYVRNHHSAVIDRDLFQQVEKIRAEKRKIPEMCQKKTIHPLSGKLVCGQCGRFYWTRNRKSYPIWYCASAAQNNGSGICQAERIYEKQLVRVCRTAVLERYELFGEAWSAGKCEEMHRELDKERNGKAGQNTDKKDGRTSTAGYTVAEYGEKTRGFIQNLVQQMEHIQQADEMERDCMFLKQQIAKSQAYVWEAEQILESLKASRKTGDWSQKKLGLEDWGLEENGLQANLSEDMEQLEQKIYHMNQELLREQNTIRKLSGQLEHLEQYWMELEEEYEWRAKAIDWMKTLPDGQRGIAGFLEGMGSSYVRAFVLMIEVISPFLYRIHWFDDVWTEVRMYSNVTRGNRTEEICMRMQEYESTYKTKYKSTYKNGRENGKDKGYE